MEEKEKSLYDEEGRPKKEIIFSTGSKRPDAKEIDIELTKKNIFLIIGFLATMSFILIYISQIYIVPLFTDDVDTVYSYKCEDGSIEEITLDNVIYCGQDVRCFENVPKPEDKDKYWLLYTEGENCEYQNSNIRV